MTYPFRLGRLLIGVVHGREGFSITTIIAKRNADGTVELGSDTLATGPSGSPQVSKVWNVNGQMYFGVAGTARYGDILQYADVPQAHDKDFEEDGFDVHKYLVTEVVPAWHQALDKAYKYDPDTSDDWGKGSIILVMKGRIFTFDGILSACEHVSYAGIGSGSDYALGALAAGKSVKKALEIAAELDLYTGGELRVERV